MATKDAPPRWDRRMQQRLERGEAAALGEFYDRFASLVHGLAHRVLGDEDAADAITRAVFTHVWEHPDAYDPKQGPLRSWVAALTHRLAVQRLRATETAALEREEHGFARELRREGDLERAGELGRTGELERAGGADLEEALRAGALERAAELERRVRRASVAARADYIVTSMPTPLRLALERAYFQRRDYRQTAADLGITEDEARRRLRLGLQLLSTAHECGPPPEHGGAR